jgi:hypothetical protein
LPKKKKKKKKPCGKVLHMRENMKNHIQLYQNVH